MAWRRGLEVVLNCLDQALSLLLASMWGTLFLVQLLHGDFRPHAYTHLFGRSIADLVPIKVLV